MSLPKFSILRSTIALAGIVLSLTACDKNGPSIDNIKALGELRVALVSVPHTYYLEPDGIQGFDYELLRAFCDGIGIDLAITISNTRAEARELLRDRKVHLAAGLMSVTSDFDPSIRFGPSYSLLSAHVLYRAGDRKPRNVEDLVDKRIETASGGIGDAELRRAAEALPTLTWQTSSERSSEELLIRLNTGEIDYAIIPSTDFMVLRLKYPHLETAFELGAPHAAAWAISDASQLNIDRAIAAYFGRAAKRGEIDALWHRYYGHYGRFDFVDARAFLRAYEQRLPAFRDFFQRAGKNHTIDWRLLAALSYQESHWNPDARSPTGVRGLMMLTERTARELEVSRTIPAEAIDGGAKYVAELRARLPKSIHADDRIWFALAAYNVGLGHVEDARVLAQRHSRNPNAWRDVREFLPSLAKNEVAATVRHGKARGGEAVQFVSNIRRYFDTFRQLSRRAVDPADTPDTAARIVANI